jgi:hypothetical protein
VQLGAKVAILKSVSFGHSPLVMQEALVTKTILLETLLVVFQLTRQKLEIDIHHHFGIDFIMVIT